MALYDSLFGLMDCQAAQVLVTSNDFADADFRKNLSATAEDLLSMNVVPVFNENDAISSKTAAELVSLCAMTSKVVSDRFGLAVYAAISNALLIFIECTFNSLLDRLSLSPYTFI